MTVSARLIAVLAIILIVFTTAIGWTFAKLWAASPLLEETQTEATLVSEHAIPLLVTIKDIKIDVIQVQQWVTDISATRALDGIDDGLLKAEEFAKKFDEDLALARTHASALRLTHVLQALDTTEQSFPPYYKTGVKMAHAYIDDGPAGGNVMMLEFDGVAETMGENMDALIAAVETVSNARLKGLQSKTQTIDHENEAVIQLNLILGAFGLFVGLIGAVYLFRFLKGTVSHLLSDIESLSRKDYAGVANLSIDRRDEFGNVAQLLGTCCSRLREADTITLEREEAEVRATQERRETRLSLADNFKSTIGAIVDTVSAAATEMQSSAQQMLHTADHTKNQSTTVVNAAQNASSNVQTVASAAEELSSSISEISRQVSQSTRISGEAVSEIDAANTKVQGLAEAANKIGEVVALITDIADQTNLLALNATIEAARAGEAGKGFAVVASEVKNLASQTARATEEISSHISGIQGATVEAVEAIGSIGGTITQINEIASAIAAAVEEQGAATSEIARNVEQAASGTQEVSSNIEGVSQSAGESGNAAQQMLEASQELSEQSNTLSHKVDTFLDEIRNG